MRRGIRLGRLLATAAGLCLALTLSAAANGAPITNIVIPDQEVPMNTTGALDSMMSFEPSDVTQGTVDFEVVAGGDLVEVDGYLYTTNSRTGTAVLQATLTDDPQISVRFNLAVLGPGDHINLRTPQGATPLGTGGNQAIHVRQGAYVISEDGQTWYPVRSDGTRDRRHPVSRGADGSFSFQPGEGPEMTYEPRVTGLTNGAAYELARVAEMSYAIYGTGFQVGEQMVWQGPCTFEAVESTGGLTGGCMGASGLALAMRQALSEALDVPLDSVECYAGNTLFRVEIPAGRSVVSQPGGLLPLASRFPTAERQMVFFSNDSGDFQSSLRPAPAAPELAGDVILQVGETGVEAEVTNLDSWAAGTSFCLVEDGLALGQISSRAIPVERTAGGVALPTERLIPGRSYRLLAQPEAGLYSQPSRHTIQVSGAAGAVEAQAGELTAGTPGTVTITLPDGAFTGTRVVTLLDVSPTTPVAAVGVEEKLSWGTIGGEVIDQGVGSAEVDFQGGVGTLSLSLNRAGEQTCVLTVGGFGAGELTARVSPGPAAGLYIQTMGASNQRALGGGRLARQPTLWLVDRFGNLAAADSATTVTARLAGISGGSGVLGGTTTVTADRGVAAFTDLSYTTASRGWLEDINAGSSDGLVFTTSTGLESRMHDGLAALPLPPVGISDSGGRLFGGEAPGVKAIARDERGIFRVQLTNADAWHIGFLAGGGWGGCPASFEEARNRGAALEVTGGVRNFAFYDTVQEGGSIAVRSDGALARTWGDARLYLIRSGLDPYWGYVDIVADAPGTGGITCTVEDGRAAVTGLEAGAWYVLSGWVYTGQNIYSNFAPQLVQAGEGAVTSAVIQGQDAQLRPVTATGENLELYLQKVEAAAVTDRALIHASRYTPEFDEPLPGMSLRFRNVTFFETTDVLDGVRAEVENCGTQTLTFTLYCAAYDTGGRLLAVRGDSAVLNAGRQCSRTFSFEWVAGIDHFKLFNLSLDGSAPLSGVKSGAWPRP